MRGPRFCILCLLLVTGTFAPRTGAFAEDPPKGIVPFGSKIPVAALAGLYEGPEIKEGGSHHMYLRVLADGTIMDLSTGDSRENVAKRMVKGTTDKYVGVGTLKLDSGRVTFTTANQDATIQYQGEVSGDTLILNWKSTYKDHVAKGEVFRLLRGL